MDCKKPEVQYIGDLQIDNLESIADYFIAERDVLDEATGNTVRALVRVPGKKLFPNANMDNIVSLVTNNTGIKIPEGQVRAVYVENDGGTAVMRYAEGEKAGIMIAVGEFIDDMVLVQCTGFVNLPEGHSYILGAQYYAGENGEPVTDSASGQKLFVPVSSTKLRINM